MNPSVMNSRGGTRTHDPGIMSAVEGSKTVPSHSHTLCKEYPEAGPNRPVHTARDTAKNFAALTPSGSRRP